MERIFVIMGPKAKRSFEFVDEIVPGKVIARNGAGSGVSDTNLLSYNVQITGPRGSVFVQNVKPEETNRPRTIMPAGEGDDCYCLIRNGSRTFFFPTEAFFIVGTNFAVNVTQTGGSPGSAAVDCDFTYTVTTLEGVEIGTGMQPKAGSRPPGGPLTPATEGFAYYDQTGVLHLARVFEGDSSKAC